MKRNFILAVVSFLLTGCIGYQRPSNPQPVMQHLHVQNPAPANAKNNTVDAPCFWEGRKISCYPNGQQPQQYCYWWGVCYDNPPLQIYRDPYYYPQPWGYGGYYDSWGYYHPNHH